MRIKAKYFAAPALAALMLGGGAAWTHTGSSSGTGSRSSGSGVRGQGCNVPQFDFSDLGVDFDIPPTDPWGVPVIPLLDGTIVYSDGTVQLPDGTIVHGTFIGGGKIQLPDGRIIDTINPGT